FFNPASSLFIAAGDCVKKLHALSGKIESLAEGSKLRQVLQRLKWPLDETENRKILDDLQRYVSLFQFALTIRGCELLSKAFDGVAQQSEILDELLNEQSETSLNVSYILETIALLPDGLRDIKEISRGLQELRTKEEDAIATLQRERILSSLSSLSFRSKHHDILRQRQPDTGQWFLDTAGFRDWLEAEEASCLWCCGVPGAGKTVLTSMVVEHVTDYSKGQDLSEQPIILPLEVKEFYSSRIMMERAPTVKDHVGLLLKILDNFTKTYIFIDALDECPEETREELLPVLETLRSSAYLFLTSRPHINVDQLLHGVSQIKVLASDADIKTYLKAKMTRRGSRLATFIARDSSLENDIVRMVSEKAGGMFLLARLQLDRLGTQTTPKNIRKALATIPSGIQATYDDAILRIRTQGEDNATLAFKVLYWIYCAKRNLEVEELLHALAVEDCDTSLDSSAFTELEILIGVCAGLVSVDEESHVLRLVHFSLQEYLKDTASGLFPDAEEQVSRTCLAYMTFDVFKEGPCLGDATLVDRLRQYRFADYASRYWGLHIRGKLESDLLDQALQYLANDKCTSSSIQISRQPKFTYKGCYEAFPKKVTSLHIAAHWGLEYILTTLLEREADIADRDSAGQTALHWAAREGNAAIVRILMKQPVEVDARDNLGRTALQLSAKHGHVDVAALLREKGARVDIPDQDGDVTLHVAAREGHDAVIRLLLATDIDVNVKNKLDLTPIHLAAIDGHDAAVRLLLENGAEVEATGKAGHTVLHMLAFTGDEGIARTLIETGAHVNAKTASGYSVLFEAAKCARSGFVKLLLDHGADINTRHDHNHGETVLKAAVSTDNTSTLAALLDGGADINRVDEWTRTPLFEAAKEQMGASLMLLLERGANPNLKAEGVCGRAPLHEAVRKMEESYVQAFLVHGAEPNTQDCTGRTPLHEAASRGHRGIVRVLLQHDADVNARDFRGRTVLQTADTETLDLLLEHGAIIGDGQVTLLEAAMFGHEATVKSLLEQGADVNAKGLGGLTPLHEAAKCQYRRANNVRILLEHGADTAATDPELGQTALHLAAWLGDAEAVRALLEHGADPNANTTSVKRAKTSLIEATRNAQDPRVIELLLENGADPNARDHGWHAQESALHVAAFYEQEEMVKILLEYGADINMKDDDARTAIQKASRSPTIKQLLEEAST
ncbi:MAG: hypothetical protein M1830_006164, partial [Pleopsidium flavum]